MLQSVIIQFGGDPTAVTSSADLRATAAHGIQMVLVDPRAMLLQSLEAILIAELADNACWEALIAFAQQVGEEGLVELFERALTAEQEHLQAVLSIWLREKGSPESKPVNHSHIRIGG